ncbi:MAG: alpha/beta hydrolase [Candidatus Obscuribacter sp.]|nr:alpha/beta hydrolase [Candidatus Obscuribacter sp.]
MRGFGVALLLTLLSNSSASAALETIKYKSSVDGSMQECWLSPPSLMEAQIPPTLIVYSHGMTSSYKEPFGAIGAAVASEFPTFGILSLGTPNAWANDGVLKDTTIVLREVLKKFPVKRVILMGSSMGGCTSLVYAEKAPEDIKEKVLAVLAIYPAGDLYKLEKLTKSKEVRESLLNATQGSKEDYRHRSFIPQISEMPKHIKVCVISAQKDIFVPPVLQKDIIKACEKNGIPNKLIEVPGDHGSIPAQRRIVSAIDYCSHKNLK